VLRKVGDNVEIISNGVFLMDTRDGRSERLLATLALHDHPAPRDVLVAGLGVGFTLSAVLSDERVRTVTVVEVEQVIVDWQASHLAAYGGQAITDSRVTVVVADLVDELRAQSRRFDVMCIDIDNGPDWTVTVDNGWLYEAAGVELLADRLAPDGTLAVWSARAVPTYESELRAHFRRVDAHPVEVARGEPDVVYLARR
jgi:spermidine synthase